MPLQNEQQRQIYEKLQNVDTKIPEAPGVFPEVVVSKDQNDSVCFLTKTITINHMTLLDEKEQKELIAPYIGQCNGIYALTRLTNELTKRYIDKGYITSRVYLTPQNIADGEVELYAVEGKIARIVSDNRKTSGAFIGLENTVLHLGNLESSIEQVNRLRSNKTEMDLVPGEAEGTTDVMLSSRETLPFFGSFGINNYGSDTTGKFQFNGSFTWENIFGFSDIFTINMNTTDKQERGRKSFGNSYVYSVPIGKWLWEGGFSRFFYNQTIYGLNDSFISHGESEVYSLGTAYKLFHTRTQNVELNAQVSRKKNLNKIEGAVIDASTYDLSVGRMGFKYVYRQPTWEMYALIDYHHGLNWFDPTKDGILKHDFSKWTLAVGGTKYIDTLPSVTYNFSGYAQYSDDLLYGVEQISIGGPYSIRGYQNQNISGSTGVYARNDIAFQMSSNMRAYLAYDLGYIKPEDDTPGGTLTSATIGLRGQYRSFGLDVYHALPLSSPDKTFGTDPFIGISASANF